MKINVNDTAAVKAALDAINGRAESFALTDPSVVVWAAKRAEERLSALPQARRPGAELRYRPAGPEANAYRRSAVSTCIDLRRGATGWFLVGVQRHEVWPKQRELFNVTVTEAQRDLIMQAAVADLIVRRERADA